MARVISHELKELIDYVSNTDPADAADVVQAGLILARCITAWTAEQFATQFPNLTAPTFSLDMRGRRYLRMVMGGLDSGRSVHLFVDKQSADVLKAATWNKPAADARYNLFDVTSMIALADRFDWAGGYLYKR